MKGQQTFLCFVCSFGKNELLLSYRCRNNMKTGTIIEENVKRIPYGVSNFVEVVEQNQYYVDKTMYLPLLEQQPNSLFFIRPRRFGKSIFLSMLRAYYDIAQKEKFRKRFEGLWIGGQPTPLQGKYQILYLDFSRVGGIGALDRNFDDYCSGALNNFALIYKTTTREGYKEYRCFEEICTNCPLRDKCISEKSKYKIVRRHVWEDHKDDNKNFLKSEKGKGIYKRRKETVERSFADSKNLHGLRYARMRGNENVREQCLLTAAVQNMKKIATKLFSRFKEINIDFLCYLEKYLYNFSLIYTYNYARKTLCF